MKKETILIIIGFVIVGVLSIFSFVSVMSMKSEIKQLQVYSIKPINNNK